MVDEADYAHVESVLKELAEAEPSIDIRADTETGGWRINTVGELQLEVFIRRLQKDYKCNIRVGTPKVRYLEKIKAPIMELTNSTKAAGREATVVLDVLPGEEGEENLLIFENPLSFEFEEVFRSIFETFCSQGVCGYGKIAGLKCVIRKVEISQGEGALPLLAKVFSDCLHLHLACADFEVFEPMMKLEIIIPEEFCGSVLADLASRGGVIRKIDSDGYNSIILLEIPLSNTFGYTTLLRSLSKGLGVYVLTYEKHGLKRSM